MRTDLTDITIVLDRSGSMAAVRADTIGGFNTFLAEQKAVPGAANLTLVQFDDQFEKVYEVLAIKEVPNLTDATFVPRGMTALLDAVGRTIHETGARLAALAEDDRPGKILLVIMTDGEENSSKEFTREQIFDMITYQRETYQWQIAFIGANQDAVKAGGSIGIPASNSLNYAGTSEGTQQAIQAMSAATASYRVAAAPATAGYFSPEDTPDGA